MLSRQNFSTKLAVPVCFRRLPPARTAFSANFLAGLEFEKVSGYTKVNIGLKKSYIARCQIALF